MGKSSANTYIHTLLSGARCVEIDAWDNKEDPQEPKVTHGMTLTSHIPFRSVCKATREALDRELADAEAARTGGGSGAHKASHVSADAQGEVQDPAPIMISLECHCSAAGQRRLVEIMHEEWGDKLVNATIDNVQDIKLEQLNGKIVCMVEYYGGQTEEDVASFSDEALEVNSSDDEETKELKKKKLKAKTKIVPELSALGCYAASVKPTSDNWLKGTMTEPPNHLINVSESACEKLVEKRARELIAHNAKSLMRVYPMGMRVTSKNLYPVPFWDTGAQVCALNWQTVSAALHPNGGFEIALWLHAHAHLRPP